MRPIAVTHAALLLVAAGLCQAAAPPMDTNPLLPANAAKKISAHVHVIRGFPNIGIIVGERATLVVDTGLGARNGALVAREAQRLSTRGQRLYLTTTHFHPEHASGQGGFPAGTIVIRNQVQQDELQHDGARINALFSSRSTQMHTLLSGAIPMSADYGICRNPCSGPTPIREPASRRLAVTESVQG
jgi:hypothetical protein